MIFLIKLRVNIKKTVKLDCFPKKRSMQLENVWKEKYGKKISVSKENKEKFDL